MKLALIFATLCVVTVTTDKVTRYTSLIDCGGPDASIKTEGAILTDPILVPGEKVLNLSFHWLTASPDDLIVRTTTIRQNDNYRVPCMDGLHGSCIFPFCSAISNFSDVMCNILLPTFPCECPVPAGTYDITGSRVIYDEQWLDIYGGVDGDYITVVEFLSAQNQIGCLQTEFTLLSAV